MQTTFKIWRTGSGKGEFQDYTTDITEGMVVLDAVHQIQAESAPDLACRWNCKAGKCGSCSAEINGKPKLMCMTRLDTIDLTEAVTIEPMRAFSITSSAWAGSQRSIKWMSPPVTSGPSTAVTVCGR